jgi:1-deoxy-D-xylulose-5-phosphate reductoisomerase
MPAVVNAANEVAVEAFLAGKISFPGIVAVVSDTASAAGRVSAPRSLEEAEEIDRRTRDRAREVVKRQPVSRSSVVAVQGAPV